MNTLPVLSAESTEARLARCVQEAHHELCETIRAELRKYGYLDEFYPLFGRFDGILSDLDAMVVGPYEEWVGYDSDYTVLVVQIARGRRRIWVGDGYYQNQYVYEPEVAIRAGCRAALTIVRSQYG